MIQMVVWNHVGLLLVNDVASDVKQLESKYK